MKVLFTDENNFSWTLLLTVIVIVFFFCRQEIRCRQHKSRLIVKRAKFAKHVMVSVGVCCGGNGKLHFIPNEAKVNNKIYCDALLRKTVEDCKSLLLYGFIFQQDGAPARTPKLAQNWIVANCSDFIGKDEWPPPTLTLLTIMSGDLCLNATRHFNPSQINTIDELKKVLQSIWDVLPQKSNQQGHTELRQKTSSLCDWHFEHVMRSTVFAEFWTDSKRCILFISIQALWWKLWFSIVLFYTVVWLYY